MRISKLGGIMTKVKPFCGCLLMVIWLVSSTGNTLAQDLASKESQKKNVAYKLVKSGPLSFEVPENWPEVQNLGPKPYTSAEKEVKSYDIGFSGEAGCSIRVQVIPRPLAGKTSPDQLLQTNLEQFKNWNREFSVIRRQVVKIGGQRAGEYEIRFSRVVPDATLSGAQIGFVVQDPFHSGIYYHLFIESSFAQGAMVYPGKAPDRRDPPDCIRDLDKFKAFYEHIKKTLRFRR